jgi:glycine betaine/proline transport system permease protein
MDPILNPFDYYTVPFGDWAEAGLNHVVGLWRENLLATMVPVQAFLNFVQDGLIDLPPLFGLIIIAALGFALSGWRLALIGLGCLGFIGAIGAWSAAMTTLSVVLTAVVFCVAVGLPIGILAARSDRFFRILRPLLDLLQTVPSFVYLLPVVMFFGIGDGPGVIVTCLFAITPLIRLTNLGIVRCAKTWWRRLVRLGQAICTFCLAPSFPWRAAPFWPG